MTVPSQISKLHMTLYVYACMHNIIQISSLALPPRLRVVGSGYARLTNIINLACAEARFYSTLCVCVCVTVLTGAVGT